jgi:hypothetical protein
MDPVRVEIEALPQASILPTTPESKAKKGRAGQAPIYQQQQADYLV